MDKVVDYMAELGDSKARVIVKTDQEPAIKTLVKDLVEAREEGRTVVEESPVRSSGSNGRAERAVQALEGHIRVLLLALEARLGTTVDAKEPIVTYMPEYAAYLLNRLEVGKDGKTAYERCKGKRATVLGLEFGEKVLYKVKRDGKLEKIRARWEHGIFVGVRPQSGEVWIAIAEKTFSVRSVRRLPPDDRWGVDCVRWPRRTLWNRYKEDIGADGDLPEEVPQKVAPDIGPRGGVVFVETRDKVPRDFYIKKSDADKHGYTRGCAGCSSWFRGLGRQPHTDACRERFRGLMRDEAKVQYAEAKRKEFEQKQVDKRRRKEEKKEEKSQRKRKAEEEADDSERAQREEQNEREIVAQEGGGQGKNQRQVVVQEEEGQQEPDAVGQKRKAEEEADDEDRWKDFCLIEEKDARKWVCELSHDHECDVEPEEDGFVEDPKVLDPVKVAEARREELDYMKKRGLWKVVPTPAGVTPVSVRWVDVLKAEGITRSRLVARDFRGNDRHRDDLFAATPPLEATRVLLSRAATETPSRIRKKVMLLDAKKAHLNPRCEEDVFIELPPEAGEREGVCGKLVFWLYGFRKAASEWERFYARKLEEGGFRRGHGCPELFFHEKRDLALAVHGDDFVACGFGEDLKWMAGYIKGCFEVKVRATLGGDSADNKEATVLGRIVRWHHWGYEYEADEKHRRLLLERFGLEGRSKALEHNGEADSGDPIDEEQDELLGWSEATEYRAAVARLNFLGQDSPDVQFPAKELSKDMSSPRRSSWARLKKAVRFLVGRARVRWKFKWQEEATEICVFADSDWGGDRRSRKSTSGGAIMLGQHCVRTWSSTQSAIAQSSAEAEVYAAAGALSEAMLVKTALEFAGFVVAFRLHLNSAAARAILAREGVGK